MAFTEIPHFEAGEPGFAAKLNQLGRVLAELIEAVEAPAPAPVPTPAAPAKRTAARSKTPTS